MLFRSVPHFKSVESRINLTRKSPEEAEEGVQVSNDMDDGGAYVDEEGNEYTKDIETDEQGPFVTKSSELLDYEEVCDDYVSWQDWGCNAGARTWAEVYLVWRKAYLTRDELHERFDRTIGKEAVDSIPLDFEPKFDDKKKQEETKELFKKATVYEIWDKSTKKAVWVHQNYENSVLDEMDDPLGLDDFFPCPKPMWATTTNNTLIPVPDYVMYQDQAEEINDLTNRIAILEKAIRARGLYPGNVDAFRQLLTMADDNDMVAIDQAQIAALATMNVGDISKIVYFWPVDVVVGAVKTLVELRKQLIEDVYQISGIGDVLRGQTDPSETATAQELKSQWGSLRVKDKQQEVQRFARDMLRIKFQIIFNKYEDDTIWLITDAMNIPDIQKAGKAAVQQFQQQQQQAATMAQAAQMQGLPPPMGGNMPPPSPEMLRQVEQQGQKEAFGQALALLRDQAMRAFRVDVETDSTVAPDDNAEKRNTTEFITAIGTFFKEIAPVVATPGGKAFAPFFGEVLMYAARRFKAAQSMETTLETAIQAFSQMPAQPQGNDAQAQADMEAEKTKQMGIQQKAQDTQINAGLEAQRLTLDRGKLALDGILAERDKDPQVVVQ